MTTKYVIFDSDGGADDAWGLLFLLKAEEMKKIKLLAVTCSHGNTRNYIGQAGVNIYRVLKSLGRLDIPIYLGAETSLIPSKTDLEGFSFYHGIDGFGDVLTDFVDYKSVTKTEHAIDVIHDLVNKYPNQVTILAVGPQTNVAIAMTMYGDKWSSKIKQIYIMGGNYKGVGNTTSASEFNFLMDPEAAHIVLTKAKCPVTVFPWEPCLPPLFNVDVDWRFDVIGNISSPFMDLLNTVEEAELLPRGYTNWEPCDAMCVAAFLFGKQVIEKERKFNAVVDCNGWLARGQMVVDHLHEHKENIRVIEKINSEMFKTIALWGVNSPSARSAFLQNPECE